MKLKTPYFPILLASALVTSAPADIIYSNLKDISIPANYDGLYLNIENGNWNTNMAAPVAGWDINPFYGGRAFANSPDFQPVRSGTTSSSSILNLAAGTTVGSGSVFSTFVQGPTGQTPGGPGYGGSQMLTGSGGNFTAGMEGYLGFRLDGNRYGSMRVVLTNNASGAMIRDWAYDTGGASATVFGMLAAACKPFFVELLSRRSAAVFRGLAREICWPTSHQGTTLPAGCGTGLRC